MSSFAFLLLCVQACLVQNVFGQYAGPGIAPAAVPAPGYAPYGVTGPFGVAPMAVELGGIGPSMIPTAIEYGSYGGSGIGDVAVAGEMPVTGTTLVAGQVPILGAVRFTGDLPAAGSVTIRGSCGCGCNRAPYY